MFDFEQFLDSRLNAQTDAGLFRERLTVSSKQDREITVDGKKYLNFASNDYLGLAKNSPDFSEQVQIGFGSGGSHLISGHHQVHSQLERELADFVERESVLTFSTGYMANLGILQSLALKGDLIIADKLNHASLIDGAKLSNADRVRYPHCDLGALVRRLKTKLKSISANKWVVTDSIFSMDGDLAPLDEIAFLCKKYHAHLIVDDAHGFGILGKNGAGALEHFQLKQKDCPVLMSTLGKAVGGYGAFVSGSEKLTGYLMQFARSYIYTTAMPAVLAQFNLGNLKKLKAGSNLRRKLQENIRYFQSQCEKMSVKHSGINSPIQKIDLLGLQQLKAKTDVLKKQGLLVGSIRPPTSSTPRLRITLSASHSFSDIECLVRYL
ncbi:MAG: 8-amino-7-oxononanoate synthase [Kangiella sp.]|nr:MAG: 8-amino-7-oxononanoate synthase [Kangiella sp.]